MSELNLLRYNDTSQKSTGSKTAFFRFSLKTILLCPNQNEFFSPGLQGNSKSNRFGATEMWKRVSAGKYVEIVSGWTIRQGYRHKWYIWGPNKSQGRKDTLLGAKRYADRLINCQKKATPPAMPAPAKKKIKKKPAKKRTPPSTKAT